MSTPNPQTDQTIRQPLTPEEVSPEQAEANRAALDG